MIRVLGAGVAGLAVATELVARGAEGIVLWCTEIPLAIFAGDFPVPVFDSNHILEKNKRAPIKPKVANTKPRVIEILNSFICVFDYNSMVRKYVGYKFILTLLSIREFLPSKNSVIYLFTSFFL